MFFFSSKIHQLFLLKQVPDYLLLTDRNKSEISYMCDKVINKINDSADLKRTNFITWSERKQQQLVFSEVSVETAAHRHLFE